MDSVRERANLFLYQSAICTDHRLLFNCFETARFIHTLRDNLKPLDHRHVVVSFGRILFDFVSVAGVSETPLQNVASCHELIIKLLHLYSAYFYFNSGPLTRPA